MAAVDKLHGLAVLVVTEEVEAYRTAGERVPPALIAQMIKLLSATGSTVPSPTKNPKSDPLAAEMPSFDDDHIIRRPVDAD